MHLHQLKRTAVTLSILGQSSSCAATITGTRWTDEVATNDRCHVGASTRAGIAEASPPFDPHPLNCSQSSYRRACRSVCDSRSLGDSPSILHLSQAIHHACPAITPRGLIDAAPTHSRGTYTAHRPGEGRRYSLVTSGEDSRRILRRSSILLRMLITVRPPPQQPVLGCRKLRRRVDAQTVVDDAVRQWLLCAIRGKPICSEVSGPSITSHSSGRSRRSLSPLHD